MHLTDVDSISKYNSFLRHLNPFGFFQKKLLAITIAFWAFCGIVKTIFNKEVFSNSDDDIPFLNLSIIVGLFSSAYLSYYYNRRLIMMILSGIYSFGGLLLILSFAEGWIIKVGLYMVSFAQYSICTLASCILFEYIDARLIPILSWAFVFSCHTSKFVSVIVFSQFDDSNDVLIILSSVILSFGLLQLGGSFIFRESLRYLIDHDIHEAEIVALQVSEQNGVSDEKVVHIIEGSFVWNKVNIKKYGLSTLWRYKSLSRETWLSFFFLGVFGKLAIVIFKINEKKKSTQFEHEVQLFWISIFQLIGFLPGSKKFLISLVIVEKLIEKRKICMTAAIVGFLFMITIAVLIKEIAIPSFLVVIFSLMGLNSFLGSVLFFFMFLQAVQFYPHTIRTLGLSLCLCCYYLGQFAFNLHLFVIEDFSSSLELILSCTLLMIVHVYNMSERLGKEVSYEIKEIEEKEYNED